MVSSSAFILEQTSSRLEMREDMVTDYNTTTRYSVRPTQRKWGSARLWDTVCPQAYSYWRMLGPRVNLSPGNATVNLSTRHKVIFSTCQSNCHAVTFARRLVTNAAFNRIQSPQPSLVFFSRHYYDGRNYPTAALLVDADTVTPTTMTKAEACHQAERLQTVSRTHDRRWRCVASSRVSTPPSLTAVIINAMGRCLMTHEWAACVLLVLGEGEGGQLPPTPAVKWAEASEPQSPTA